VWAVRTLRSAQFVLHAVAFGVKHQKSMGLVGKIALRR
jgi:hypothetical protein